jgi:hypothetical protein
VSCKGAGKVRRCGVCCGGSGRAFQVGWMAGSSSSRSKGLRYSLLSQYTNNATRDARGNQSSTIAAACAGYGVQIYLSPACSLRLVSATAAAIHGYFGLTADVIQPLCELRESHPVILQYAREPSQTFAIRFASTLLTFPDRTSCGTSQRG